MYEAGYRETVFQFFILNTVTADQYNTGLLHHFQATFQDSAKNGNIHLVDGKRNQVHGGFGNTTHGIDVAQCIGSGYLTEPEGIVDNGRKEVYGLDDSQIIRYPVNTGIVSPLEAYQYIGVLRQFKATECFVQVPWSQFRGSPCTGDSLG